MVHDRHVVARCADAPRVADETVMGASAAESRAGFGPRIDDPWA